MSLICMLSHQLLIVILIEFSSGKRHSERRRGCNWTPVSATGTPSLAAELPVDPEQVIQQRQNEKKLLVEVNKM